MHSEFDPQLDKEFKLPKKPDLQQMKSDAIKQKIAAMQSGNINVVPVTPVTAMILEDLTGQIRKWRKIAIVGWVAAILLAQVVVLILTVKT